MGRKKTKQVAASAGLRKRLAQVRACERSGESLKAYAERHGLSVTALYEAKRRARQQGLLPSGRTGAEVVRPLTRQSRPGSSRFVEAVARSEPAETASGFAGWVAAWRLRFPSGAILETNTPLATDDALRLIEQLGGRR